MFGYLLAIFFGLLTLALPLIVVAQTPAPVHDPSKWHAPGFGHEHGDPCPPWVTDLTTNPSYAKYWTTDFTWPGNTSPIENVVQDPVSGKFGKHFAFKQMSFRSPDEAFTMTGDHQYGFTTQDGGPVTGCIIGHLSGTPGDRGAEPHSFRIFLRDETTGAITIRGGWVHTADPTHDHNIDETRVPKKCQASAAHEPCLDEGYTSANPNVWMTDQRPIWLVIDQETYDGKYTPGHNESFGQVYFSGVGASWGWGMNESTVFQKGETASQIDPSTWTPMPGSQAHGQLRLIEVTMPRIAGLPAGGAGWWSCPNGTVVSEQFAPECGPQGALLQWVAAGSDGVFTGLKGRFQQEWPIDRASTGVQN